MMEYKIKGYGLMSTLGLNGFFLMNEIDGLGRDC